MSAFMQMFVDMMSAGTMPNFGSRGGAKGQQPAGRGAGAAAGAGGLSGGIFVHFG